MKTIYLVSQVKKNEGSDGILRLLRNIMKTYEPSNPASRTPVHLHRIYHFTTNVPKYTAETMAEHLGDLPVDETQRFCVGKGGTSKGNTTVPLRDDLRGVLYPGDYIAFDKVPNNEEEEDQPQGQGARGQPLLVVNVYAQSIEIEQPGLSHRVTGKTCFRLYRCHRACATPYMDSSREKNAVGFMRHQQNGSVFVLTHGIIQKVLPRMLEATSTDVDPSHISLKSQQLLAVLRNNKRPYCLQLSYEEGGASAPDCELLTVFSASGGPVRPFARRWGACTKALVIIIIVVLFLAAFLAVWYTSVASNQEKREAERLVHAANEIVTPLVARASDLQKELLERCFRLYREIESAYFSSV